VPIKKKKQKLCENGRSIKSINKQIKIKNMEDRKERITRSRHTNKKAKHLSIGNI
jgi:hypothetical protein